MRVKRLGNFFLHKIHELPIHEKSLKNSDLFYTVIGKKIDLKALTSNLVRAPFHFYFKQQFKRCQANALLHRALEKTGANRELAENETYILLYNKLELHHQNRKI